MDALMAALVAALLLTFPDRAAFVAASAARPGPQIAATLLVSAMLGVVSVAIGTALAPRLTLSARTMLLAVALAMAGLELVMRRLPATPPRHGSVALAASGLWFVAIALAMRSALPWLAVPGAVIGTTVAVAIAVTMGTTWRALPLTALRRTIGALAIALAAILASVALGIA